MSDAIIPMPPTVANLVRARNQLRDEFGALELRFTFDGNLIGDLGEAMAAKMFGIKLVPRNGTGIDGYAPDGRTVQIKATGTGYGPAFRDVETRANHLLFLAFNFDDLIAEVVFNGPEDLVLKDFPDRWSGQKSVRMAKIKKLAKGVATADQLVRLRG